MTEPTDSITELTAEIRRFAQERDWEQFHDPKSLVLALVGEVGELAELFQWIPADHAVKHFSDEERRRRVAEEISDVLIYLLRLADVLGVDLASSARAKLNEAISRFSVDAYRSTAPDKL